MLAADTAHNRPLKQGWVFKRGGSRFISHWRLKYLVLLPRDPASSAAAHTSTHGTSSSSSSKCDFVLQIFDQVDQIRPPKHEIYLRDAQVHVPGTTVSQAKFAGLKRGAAGFVVYTRQRKFYFAAQTKGDRDDWLSILQPDSHNSSNNHRRSKSITYLPTPSQTASRASSDAGGGDNAPTAPVRRSTSRYRTWSRRDHNGYDNDDAMSMYSVSTTFDDAASFVSTSSRGTALGDGDDARSIASSHVTTLSFCSEPVLTPQELNMMSTNPPLGTGNGRGEETFTFRDTLRRRRAPLQQMEQSTQQQAAFADRWNERYQSLLAMQVDTEEAALRQDVQIVELIGAFQELAQQHARRLIDEYHIQGNTHVWQHRPGSPVKPHPAILAAGEDMDDDDERRGRGGGGGAKRLSVVMDGIVFHFACDYDEATPAIIQDALSRTSAELCAIDATTRASFCHLGTGGPHLHTALMALIDYKGFRVVAYADTGLDGKGLRMYDLDPDNPVTDERACERLAAVGRALNLKPHAVQVGEERRVTAHTAAGVQSYRKY
ncbi:hypothetical protein HK104_008043 [Borealophlyctis nickersoniae]|nr:hypothetical protein HK104_008043 [Borealophlyctis nickersoniae]